MQDIPWFSRMRDGDGSLALDRAGEFEEEEIRAWLLDVVQKGLPGQSPMAEVDPVSLFEDAWEANPGGAFRGRMESVVTGDFPRLNRKLDDHGPYLCFLARLMLYLPISDIPEKASGRVMEIRSARRPSLRAGRRCAL